MDGKKIDKNAAKKTAIDIIFIVIASLFGALGVRVFATNAQFAPAGIDGVCFMLNKLVGLDIDIWEYIINIPLIIIGYIFLKRKYVIYTLIFTLLTNIFLRIFIWCNMPMMQMSLDDIGMRLLCCVFTAILFGFRTGFMLRVGGSSGGLDIPACMIAKKWKGLNVELIILALCLVLIGVSYFVYEDFVSLLLSVLQIVISSMVTNYAMKGARNAIECKIVTKHPDEVKDIIIVKMRHTATVLPSKGAFSNEESTTMLTVINVRELSNFLNAINQIPDTFVYYSAVNGLQGNFRWRSEDEAK